MNISLSPASMAESLFHAMNEREFSEVIEYLDEKIVFDFPGTSPMTGKKRVILGLKIILRKYPELYFNITETISHNDRLCVTWTNKGKDIYGNPYTNSGITLFHFTHNKITFISDYFKDTSFVDSKQ